MIVCGWCGHPTADLGRCAHCLHIDPAKPWLQRGEEPPRTSAAEIREADNRTRLAAARQALVDSGQRVTRQALADALGVDERTVRRWMSAR